MKARWLDLQLAKYFENMSYKWNALQFFFIQSVELCKTIIDNAIYFYNG